jgi:hypothetical protein
MNGSDGEAFSFRGSDRLTDRPFVDWHFGGTMHVGAATTTTTAYSGTSSVDDG